jgi:hypothetical protein
MADASKFAEAPSSLLLRPLLRATNPVMRAAGEAIRRIV